MTCHTDNCKATGGFGLGLGLRRGCGAPARLRDFNSGSPLHPAAAGQGSPPPNNARRPQHARPALAARAPCPAHVPPPRYSRVLQVLLQGGLHPPRLPAGRDPAPRRLLLRPRSGARLAHMTRAGRRGGRRLQRDKLLRTTSALCSEEFVPPGASAGWRE